MSGAPRPVSVWAADRGAGRLVALDRDLFALGAVDLRWPIEVKARTDGGAWVAAAKAGDPLGKHELVLVTEDRGVAWRTETAPLLDLAAVDGDDALAVEWLYPAQPQVNRVLHVDADGAVRVVVREDAITCVAGRRDRVLFGTRTGQLVLLDSGGTELRRVAHGGVLVDVAPAAADRWWVLDGASPGRLSLLAADLATQWTVVLGFSPLHLAPSAVEERVWLADVTQPFARRYGPGGKIELELQPLPLSGLDRAEALPGGGALIAAPGALLRLDASGALAPGQGGFTYLTDVSRVPGR